METTIDISRVGLEGQGVGYDAEGNIYFIPGTVPGDRVRVGFATTKKYRDAELLETLVESSERQTSNCAYFQNCGGCDWLNWKYESQLKAKEDSIKHVMQRADWATESVLPILGAEKTYGYRTRVQLRRKGNRLGFYRRKSHDIVDVKSCAVAADEINQEIEKIRSEVPKYPEGVTKIELFLGEDGKVHRMDDSPHSAAGFTQIHREQNQLLQREVAKLVQAGEAKNVLELYCGDGNLTFSYLPLVEKVMAFDSSSAAIEAARLKRGAGDEQKVAFFCDRVDSALPRKMPTEFRGHYDTLVIDPPRQGMEGFLERFIHPKLKSIVMVSCSPVSFTKDIQVLRKEFQLVSVQPIDMFPHTRHTELVARFQRS